MNIEPVVTENLKDSKPVAWYSNLGSGSFVDVEFFECEECEKE
jgi:hypothetical protein